MISNEDKSFNEIYNFLNESYKKRSGGKNYALYLNSMCVQKKIKRLISLYYGVRVELFSFIDRDKYNKLNNILNREIKRIFEQNEYSDKLAFECIVNLKESDNFTEILDFIKFKSSSSVQAEADEIFAAKKRLEIIRSSVNDKNYKNNGNKGFEDKYIKDMRYLVKKGYVKDKYTENYEKSVGIIDIDFKDWLPIFIVTFAVFFLIYYFELYFIVGAFVLIGCALFIYFIYIQFLKILFR